MKEETIFPIIQNLLKTAHTSKAVKEDLFQDLYLYHLQLEQRYKPELNVPLEAFIIKFLTWRMWTLIKTEYSNTTDLIAIMREVEGIPDYREKLAIDLSPLMQGIASISTEDITLLILRHVKNMSYQELSQHYNLSIEGIRKTLIKIERKVRWEGINKKTVTKDE